MSTPITRCRWSLRIMVLSGLWIGLVACGNDAPDTQPDSAPSDQVEISREDRKEAREARYDRLDDVRALYSNISEHESKDRGAVLDQCARERNDAVYEAERAILLEMIAEEFDQRGEVYTPGLPLPTEKFTDSRVVGINFYARPERVLKPEHQAGAPGIERGHWNNLQSSKRNKQDLDPDGGVSDALFDHRGAAATGLSVTWQGQGPLVWGLEKELPEDVSAVHRLIGGLLTGNSSIKLEGLHAAGFKRYAIVVYLDYAFYGPNRMLEANERAIGRVDIRQSDRHSPLLASELIAGAIPEYRSMTDPILLENGNGGRPGSYVYFPVLDADQLHISFPSLLAGRGQLRIYGLQIIELAK